MLLPGPKAVQLSEGPGASEPLLNFIVNSAPLQTISHDYWQHLFGKQDQPIHRTFMDLLGNLSLVTSKLNKQMSNKPFADKLDWMK